MVGSSVNCTGHSNKSAIKKMLFTLLIFIRFLAEPVILANGSTNSHRFDHLTQSNPIKGKNGKTEIILSRIINRSEEGIAITGSPGITDCKYGQALSFNGSSDGIFLDQMPLEGLGQFTIEAIIFPSGGGNFEQRFIHIGEIQGSRVLMEIRTTATDWYFDAYVKSGDQQITLVKPTLTHPLNQWYHVAFVISNSKQATYINGKKELESQITIVPFRGGKTSIGVRQNKQSWFKGAIYKIKITPKALQPWKFMAF